ncbi:MAG: hypothetical protein JW944_08380 [Deltaproteobacteria bacterium]|nr:hypothetical protein [Deltaproteobacteria bacterium]
MTTLFLIFNHTFTGVQRADALKALDVTFIEEMPPSLKEIWKNIPSDLESIDAYLEPIQTWLKVHAVEDDYVLIQGDFGACYIMVNFAFRLGLIPIYSTTDRETEEEFDRNGGIKVTHHFQHRIFRRYESL